MEINKQIITELIEEFKQKKDSVFIKKENLTKFKPGNKEDDEFLSYSNGVGGYYVKFLNFIIKKLQPEVIVELGNREAVSTVSIFDAAQTYGGEFYTIDIEKDQRYCPDEMFNNPKTHFLFGDVCSYDIVKQIPKKIDFLFSDTIHFDFQIRDEFEIYQHLLSDTALIAIDDIKLNDKGKFFDEIYYDKWDLTELCHSSGWGLLLFKRKNSTDESTQNTKLLLSIIKVWERKYQTNHKELSRLTYKQKLKAKLKSIKFIHKTKLALVSIFKK